jgi:DNA repair protein RecO (recombination protein O)
MTKNIKTSGIVLKESNLGENGKLLVFFTKDFGKISVVAKGVKKTSSSLVQLSQLFAYSNLELYKGNSNLYTLTGGSLIESFSGLGEDYDRIASAGEIVLNILKVIQEDLPDIDSLRLLLNSLHFISSGKRSPDFVATVFLLKMLQFQGVVPEIYEIEQMWNQKLNDSTINALEHIFYSELSELFNFGVSDFVKMELKGVSKMLLSEIN